MEEQNNVVVQEPKKKSPIGIIILIVILMIGCLVGGYFYIDRVSIARLNIKTHKLFKKNAWYNPKISVKHEVYCNDDIIPDWGKALGVKNYIRFDDCLNLDDNNPLKEIFKVDNTTASISFELVVNGVSFGLMRFDMTTGVRHWTTDNFQVFMLISQLVATYLQKNYLKEINYKALYFDSKYNGIYTDGNIELNIQ